MNRNNMKRSTTQVNRNQQGFSLIELLLVLVILGVLAAIVVPKLSGQSEKARITAARSQIGNLDMALGTFEIEMGRFPTSSEGLDALVEQPSGSNADQWDGPYLNNVTTVPKDPWGNDYVYRIPSSNNNKNYDLFSVGPDGSEDTDDDVNASGSEKDA